MSETLIVNGKVPGTGDGLGEGDGDGDGEGLGLGEGEGPEQSPFVRVKLTLIV